jgi:hypothetical protein
MKLIKLEKLGEGEIFFRGVIEKSVGRWWQFWKLGTEQREYVGNQLGWYDAVGGGRVTSNSIQELLTGAVRMLYIKELMTEELPPLTIIKED